MTQRFGGFLLLLGAGWGCGCRAGCMGEGGGPRFVWVLFLSANNDENQNIKLNKNITILSVCRTSLWCVAGIFALTNDGLWQPGEGAVTWFGFDPDPRFWLNKLIRPVRVSQENAAVLLVCQYGLSGFDTPWLLEGYDLQFPILSWRISSQPQVKSTSSWGYETNPKFSRTFFWIFIPNFCNRP